MVFVKIAGVECNVVINDHLPADDKSPRRAIPGEYRAKACLVIGGADGIAGQGGRHLAWERQLAVLFLISEVEDNNIHPVALEDM